MTEAIVRVSVVVPTFNVAPYIERAILSAAEQTYPELEIIVVDDGSTDDTVAILQGLSEALPNLTLLERPHCGVSFARNAGVEAARGAYVAFLDGDDIWHPIKIEKQMAALQRHDFAPEWVGCYSLYRWIDEADRLIQDGPRTDIRGHSFASHLAINFVGNGSNLLVRRDAVLGENGFDGTLRHCEDYDLQLRLLRHGKIELVPEYLMGYRRRPNSASTRFVEAAAALIELAERHSADPDLPAGVRHVAVTSAHRHAWYQFIKGGMSRAGLRSYLAYLRAEPAEASLDLAIRLARSVMHPLASRSALGVSAPPRGAPDFAHLDPTFSQSLDDGGGGLRISARFEQWRTERISARTKSLDALCHPQPMTGTAEKAPAATAVAPALPNGATHASLPSARPK